MIKRWKILLVELLVPNISFFCSFWNRKMEHHKQKLVCFLFCFLFLIQWWFNLVTLRKFSCCLQPTSWLWKGDISWRTDPKKKNWYCFVLLNILFSIFSVFVFDQKIDSILYSFFSFVLFFIIGIVEEEQKEGIRHNLNYKKDFWIWKTFISGWGFSKSKGFFFFLFF